MPNPLDSLIHSVQQHPLPDCPARVPDNVLRRVRLAQDDARGSFLAWLYQCMPQPGFIASALAFAILISATVSFTSSRAFAADRQSELQRSLGFESIRTPPALSICNCNSTPRTAP